MAQSTEYYEMKLYWNPNNCEGECDESKLINAFTVGEFLAANTVDGPLYAPMNFSRPTGEYMKSQLPSSVNADINCIWINTKGPNEEIWADEWGDGSRTGYSPTAYFQAIATAYKGADINTIMYNAQTPPEQLDAATLVNAINAGIGKKTVLECDNFGNVISVICLAPTFEYQPIDCPYPSATAPSQSCPPGPLGMTTVTNEVKPECAPYIPYTTKGITSKEASPPPTPLPVSTPPSISPVPVPEPNTPPAPEPTSDASGSSTNIAAIVGGVVGGVCALLLGLAGFLLYRKKKSEDSLQSNSLNRMETGTPIGMQYVPAGPVDGTRSPFGETGSGSLSWPTTGANSPATMASDPLIHYINSRLSTQSPSSHLESWQLNFADINLDGGGPIGEGSWGRVYLAKFHGAEVAIKILMGETRGTESSLLQSDSPIMERLEQEASMMSNLHHPNIVQFLGVTTFPAAVVTEFCARGSLFAVLQRAGSSAENGMELTWSRRMSMAADAARGMLYLHTRSPQVVHRDLKSANLLVTSNWVVKVSDFNLSKIFDDSTKSTTVQAMNPRWLAPEVFVGSSVTMPSDVFSFGVVLWELLTWELPWGTKNPWAIVDSVREGGRLPIPAPDELPGPNSGDWPQLPRYIELLQRCWAQEPQARPSFAEIFEELKSIDPLAVNSSGSF